MEIMLISSKFENKNISWQMMVNVTMSRFNTLRILFIKISNLYCTCLLSINTLIPLSWLEKHQFVTEGVSGIQQIALDLHWSVVEKYFRLKLIWNFITEKMDSYFSQIKLWKIWLWYYILQFLLCIEKQKFLWSSNSKNFQSNTRDVVLKFWNVEIWNLKFWLIFGTHGYKNWGSISVLHLWPLVEFSLYFK